LPLLDAQRWLLPRAPGLLALLLVLLMSASLAWQSVAWQRLLQRAPVIPSSAHEAPQNRDMQGLLGLFGAGPSAATDAPSTSLRVTLLGSFVQADSPRSSAIIQLDGRPAQRYLVGQTLSSGVSLHAVYRDRVELKRNGRLETLAFSKPQGTPASSARNPPDSDTLNQLQALDEQDSQHLQQRMQALREQIQAAAATTPASDANRESPEPPTEAN